LVDSAARGDSDERALLDAARCGDLSAYERLARRQQALAFRAAWLITRDEAEAEDAVQDAFLKAYAALGSFRAGAPFRPWLLRIVTHEALNRRRAASRRAGLALRLGAMSGFVAQPSPEDTVLAREQRAFVIAQLDQLAEPERLVLSYRYLLDLSVAEIAVALDCPESTVRTRCSRALAHLREQLQRAAAPASATEPTHE
jgi:RNA polymerase sigma-70 factor (ECF subfamily)